MGVDLARRLFTVQDYYRMAEVGILTEADRVELLNGEIVHMTPIGTRHADCVDRLNQLLVERLARRAIVRIQNPIRLGEHSEPQPDLALVRPGRTYAAAHLGPQDILLIVEVAETSVDKDRDVKIPLYGQAGIPEAWLIDLPGAIIDVYLEPLPQGCKQSRRLGRGEYLAPIPFPDVKLAVNEVLG